ncbi:DUF3558 family protein [Kineosporia sp. A_224]|uniref:DUF3558 family protein n=1 Tax=Kineosporia sp. A_224 TaxID=1962180 RepID=UPI00117A662F|nr:DUF3558 family protein [Kineosporia sp. A_224]
MRMLPAVAFCVLVAGCASTDPQTSASTAVGGTSASSSSAPSASASAGAVAPCDLLSSAERATLAGRPVGKPSPGATGGMPLCKWPTADGGFVQAASAPASQWAQSLPELLRLVEASNLITDDEGLEKLREGGRIVAGGQRLDAVEACAMFSRLVELQGVAPGRTSVVNVLPTLEDPSAVSGQMCSEGTYTSVMVANVKGLDEPLPVEKVETALESAHRRATG